MNFSRLITNAITNYQTITLYLINYKQSIQNYAIDKIFIYILTFTFDVGLEHELKKNPAIFKISLAIISISVESELKTEYFILKIAFRNNLIASVL